MNEPLPNKKREGRNLRRERRRWDDSNVHNAPLGCITCSEYGLCGGLHKRQRDYDCLGDCCGDPTNCDNVCPRNFDVFVERCREVDGFDLNNIPRATPLLPPDLPSYIPLIFHGSSRVDFLDAPAVALPLHKFYNRRDGSLRYKARTDFEAAFKLRKNTRIILVGCGRDKPIEGWWGLSSQRRVILKTLSRMGIELVTSPNYSVFTDVPRHDNLFNIKRIGNAWYEAIDSGIPCSLHLNARTVQDYARLSEFIQRRAEATDVAFEFKTGGAWFNRREFHQSQLAQLARRVTKPLRMIMIGGLPAIPILAPAYDRLTFVDTSAFMKAMYRQRLIAGNDGNVLGVTERSELGEAIDALLANNIALMRTRIERLINESRSKKFSGGSGQTQESPETNSSAPVSHSSSRAVNR